MIAQIETIKRKLNRPDLQFDIVAHSMGGLIARYAAMYGAADLPSNDVEPSVTWAGGAHINTVYLIGVPNRGAVTAFTALLNGWQLGGGKLLPTPIRFSSADTFTIPALYQLLPSGSNKHILDENLMPLEVDLYNADTWVKYNWGAIADNRNLKKTVDGNALKTDFAENRQNPFRTSAPMKKATFDQKYAYLQTVLTRAKRFHRALAQLTDNSSVNFFAFGSVCKATLDAVVVFQNSSGKWMTLTKAKKLNLRTNHSRSKAAVRAVMYRDGDGRVTQKSFSDDSLNLHNLPDISQPSRFIVCENHDSLLNNQDLLNKIVENLHRDGI